MRLEEAEKVDSLLDMVDEEQQFLKLIEADHTAPPSGVSLISRSSTYPV